MKLHGVISHDSDTHHRRYLSRISCHRSCHRVCTVCDLDLSVLVCKKRYSRIAMTSKEILKIIPDESVLVRNEPIKCSVAECKSVFTKSSNLNMHLERHHKISVPKMDNSNLEVQYHCPAKDCVYNRFEDEHAKYFKTKKYLRQHYMKVHAAKTAQCGTCDKSFASATFLRQHEIFCGMEFQCGDCDAVYTSRECLLTHCRRKSHSPHLTSVSSKRLEQRQTKRIASERSNIYDQLSKFAQNGKLRIEPKQLPPTSSKESPLMKIRATLKRNVVKKTRKKISQETQTASLYNTNCSKAINKANQASIKSKSIAVGTTNEPPALSKYRNLDLIDDESSTMIDNQSQTSSRNLNSLNYVEDDCSLNYFTVGNFNSGLCHIETQTELIASDCAEGARDMDPLLCHMHTQTSDQILTELGLSDIQTQTHWPDGSPTDNNELFVSAETQTYSPYLILSNISAQTQTAPPNE